MILEKLKDKKILILGFGLEGKSAYAFLKHFYPNQVIDIADVKDDPNYLEKQKNYDIIVKSPSIHKSKITGAYTTPTNIFFANVKGMTIGITGSKGKSTTSSLTYSVLKEAGKNTHLVGNITHKLDSIGEPMLDGLLKSNKKNDVWVVELSSYQLDDITYSPHITVITSFFPEHIDFHGSLDAYWQAKTNILSFAKKTDFYVYNSADEKLTDLTKTIKAQPVPFIDCLPFPDSTVPLLGKHNNANIRAVCAVAGILGISDDIVARAIKNFTPLPHRLEKVGAFKSITFYDDAISTTPESTMLAIETLKNVSTIFLGGQDRGYNFDQLAEKIIEYKILNLVLFPDTGTKIYEAIRKVSTRKFNVLRTKDMREAVKFAYDNTSKGTICLLSTASPSYSIWTNFEEKGNLFKQYARELGKE